MATDEEIQLRSRRRAWWLKVARAGRNQSGVAKALGLSEKSASSVGDWERGETEPSLRQLEQLAALYGVPVSVFTEPQETDEERLERIIRDAEERERGDWEGEAGSGPKADGGPAGARRTRAA